jgi:hypothetical protein
MDASKTTSVHCFSGCLCYATIMCLRMLWCRRVLFLFMCRDNQWHWSGSVACGSTTGNFLVRGQLLHFIRVEKAGMPDESIVPMLVSRTCGSVSILRFCHEWGKRTICSKNIRDAIEEIVIGKCGKSIGMIVDVCKNKFGRLGQHSDTQEGKGRCTPKQPSRFQKLKTGMASGCSGCSGRPKPVPIPDPGLRRTALINKSKSFAGSQSGGKRNGGALRAPIPTAYLSCVILFFVGFKRKGKLRKKCLYSGFHNQIYC